MKLTEPKNAAENFKSPSAAWLLKSCATQAPALGFKLACGMVGRHEENEEHNLASVMLVTAFFLSFWLTPRSERAIQVQALD